MNIFATDEDPAEAASHLDDVRLRKMLIETCQMLATALRNKYNIDAKGLYKAAYVNHPCTKWVMQSDANYCWLYEYMMGLAVEHRHRFGPKKAHAALLQVKLIIHYTPVSVWMSNFTSHTPFVNCSGFDSGDVNQDYRECLNNKWHNDIRRPKWANSCPPAWKL